MTIIAQNKCYTRSNCHAVLRRHSFTLCGELTVAKGMREVHEVQKSFHDLSGNGNHDLRIRSTVALPTKLRSRTMKVWSIKVMNRGEEKVRVHTNVVPRSTMNTNGVEL